MLNRREEIAMLKSLYVNLVELDIVEKRAFVTR